MKGRSRIITEETRIKIRETHLKNKKNNVPKLDIRKPIYQLDKKTKIIIKEWPSAKAAADELGIRPNHIYSCCVNKLKSAHGFIWIYKNT